MPTKGEILNSKNTVTHFFAVDPFLSLINYLLKVVEGFPSMPSGNSRCLIPNGIEAAMKSFTEGYELGE